jgi:carbon monoxide dehydrogenase subunit G
MREWTSAAIAGLLAFTLILAAEPIAAAGDREMAVSVRVDGDVVHVDSALFVKATPQEVWAVLTDFEHMTQFISNLRSSAVVARSEGVVTVAQSWEASLGPLGFASQSTREMRLMPFEEIQSRMISGTLKQFRSVTRLKAEGEGTHVTYQSDTVPNQWIPPIVGPHFVEREAREQMVELRREILRRQSAPAEAVRQP